MSRRPVSAAFVFSALDFERFMDRDFAFLYSQALASPLLRVTALGPGLALIGAALCRAAPSGSCSGLAWYDTVSGERSPAAAVEPQQHHPHSPFDVAFIFSDCGGASRWERRSAFAPFSWGATNATTTTLDHEHRAGGAVDAIPPSAVRVRWEDDCQVWPVGLLRSLAGGEGGAGPL